MALEDIDIFGRYLQTKQLQQDQRQQVADTIAPTPAQATYMASFLAPGSSIPDVSGIYPSFPSSEVDLIDAFSGDPMPSLSTNLREGNYFDASMQGLGMAGDALYATPMIGPVLGATAGTGLKAVSGVGRGIASLNIIQKAQDLMKQGKATAGTQEATKKMLAPNKIKEGKIVEVRRNLASSFDDPELEKFKAQTIHDVPILIKTGKPTQAQSLIGDGKAITYDPAVTLKSNGVPIELKVNQTARDSIASGTKAKFPMAAVRGIYDELDIFDPDEIFRFNPKKQNVFVDSQGYGVKEIKNGKATTINEEVFVKLDNPDSFRIIKDADGNEVKLFDDIEYYDSKNLPKTKNPSEVKVLDASVDTSYRIQHQARGLESDAIRLDDLTKDISGNTAGYPSDFYGSQGQRYYAPGPRFKDDEFGIANQQSYNIITKVKNKPDAEVTIYRAVPKGIKNINEGDFVTLSPKYAELHSSSGYGRSGDEVGNVISQKVKVKDLIWDANDVNEFGYFPTGQ